MLLNALRLLFLLILAGCGKPAEVGYEPSFSKNANIQIKEYIVGIHPLHNPQRLIKLYGSIVEYIDANIPNAEFRLEASRSYEEFDKKLDAGYFDFAMPNPYQTLRSLKHGYHVFGKMGGDQDFRGIILVRKDSGIQQVADLKGKVVSFPAATALAAAMMPQYYLHTHGLDVNKDIVSRYVGSQDSSILSVLRGRSAAGGTWTVPWKSFSAEHPDMANQLEVKWQTEPLQSNGWVVRNDVPQEITEQFKMQLFSLNNSEQGRRMLARLPASHFESATDKNYLPVAKFLQVFSKEVRRVEW